MECIGGTTGKEICPNCGSIITLYFDDDTNPVRVKSANPVCARCTCIRSISSSKFNISGLKSDEFNFLESMYKKLEEDCLYRFINSYMLGGDMTYGTITIASPPYGMGEANTNYLGNLTLVQGITTTYRTFRHEWRHFYQREYWNISKDDEVKLKNGMMEFENAVYADIESYQTGTENGLNLIDDDEVTSWIYDLDKAKLPSGSPTMKDYIAWIIRLSTDKVDLSLPAEIATAQKWATLFGKYSRRYGTSSVYQYEGVDYQFNALSNLIKISKNCK